MSAGVPAGLCGLCRHALLRTTGRGTSYLRCARASTDPRFARYPQLPVLACPGFEPAEPTGPTEPTEPTEPDRI